MKSSILGYRNPERLALSSLLIFIRYQVQIKLCCISGCEILWIVRIISFGGYVCLHIKWHHGRHTLLVLIKLEYTYPQSLAGLQHVSLESMLPHLHAFHGLH